MLEQSMLNLKLQCGTKSACVYASFVGVHNKSVAEFCQKLCCWDSGYGSDLISR
jgi:hypothetical protein